MTPSPLSPSARRAHWRRTGQVLMGWAAMGVGLTHARAAEKHLPVAASLPEALTQAMAKREPLVVMVSLQGCAFCKVVRESHLLPMQADGLPVVQIDMRQSTPIVDFGGKSLTHDEWVRQRGIRIAPTVLFFGRDGLEVATRLKGAYLPDFYGAYLDEQLNAARRAVLKQWGV